jgi:hypothetical protein
MQESFGWPPYDEVRLPWETRLFALYTLALSIFLLVRTVQLTAFLWRSRKAKGPSPPSPESRLAFVHDLRIASIKAVSLRRATVLTLLLCVAITAEQIVSILRGISVERRFLAPFFAGSISEALVVFAIGISACSVLYAGYAFFTGRISRLKVRLEDNQSESLN